MDNDIVCFSHLRWNFVYQRPQHLLSRFGKSSRIFFIEEPVFYDDVEISGLEITKADDENVWIIVPHIYSIHSSGDIKQIQEKLIGRFFFENNIRNYILWYYSPLALSFTGFLTPELVVFDCMDELSAFKNASSEIIEFEKKLFYQADIVFTGGQSLYEAKRTRHKNIFSMPSAINKSDFYPARAGKQDPHDQFAIPHPRLGFYGVIDERFDVELIRKLAILRPDFNFVFIGPVVKIDPADLPRLSNIHYLGSKDYKELTRYISGWDICIMPFAINEATRYISPTKTPEFLAAGKPVISTPICDVIDPYGKAKMVYICNTPDEFSSAADKELAIIDKTAWLGIVDNFLSGISWDKTYEKMNFLIQQTMGETKLKKHSKTDSYV